MLTAATGLPLLPIENGHSCSCAAIPLRFRFVVPRGGDEGKWEGGEVEKMGGGGGEGGGRMRGWRR